MKKSLIAAGAASFAVAAMPVVGVFAADGTLTQTDTVIVTVDSACSLATSGSSLDPASTYTATIANGAARAGDNPIAGSTFTVTCNDNAGWQISAVGAGTGTTVAHMDASTGADDDIATGTTLDGTVSDWAFKVSGANGATIQGSYDGYSEVPTTAAVIAKGTTTTTTATVTAAYGVGISPTQEAGTYTGKVAYTLAHPAN